MEGVWSSAMVAAPLLRGLLGLEPDAAAHTLSFAPHVPPDWTSFRVNNVRVGSSTLDMKWSKALDAIRLEVTRRGQDACDLDFSPAVSLRAKIRRVLLNGRAIPFHLETNSIDQHVRIHAPTTNATETISIELADDFGITETTSLPLAGSSSRGVRVTSEKWSPQLDVLTLELDGPAASQGTLGIWNPRQVASVDGATLVAGDDDRAQLAFQMPQATAETNVHLEIAIHFGSGPKRRLVPHN